ncbi:MAG TPA: hypothetical protein VEL76_43385 [Gemmataceae bacterium]|nr:hypothetical protein [Gemmataceae bacterium]
MASEIKPDAALVGAAIMMLSSVNRGGEPARCRDLEIAAYLSRAGRAVRVAGGGLDSRGQTGGAHAGKASLSLLHWRRGVEVHALRGRIAWPLAAGRNSCD